MFRLMPATAFAAFALAGPAQAADESNVTFYGGGFHTNHGYDDGWFLGSFANLYHADLGVHGDLVYVDRARHGAFGSLGLSQRFGRDHRLKFMAGTSSGRQCFLPNLYLNTELELHAGKGLIARPMVSYRRFRGGASEWTPGLQLAGYFDLPGDKGGYYVAQADSNIAFNNSGKAGWTLGGGVSTIRKSGWTLGATARVGHFAYDNFTGAGVRSTFQGASANVGYRIKGGPEVYVHGDLTHNRYYTVTGAFLGLKFGL